MTEAGSTTGARVPSALRWVAAVAGAAGVAYAAYVAAAWSRYGHPSAAAPDVADPLLDRFMPVYDIVERHHARIDAPASVTFAAAREMELSRMPLVHAIFRAREILLGSRPDDRPRPGGLLAEMQSLGWQVIAEVPDRQVVVGAVTRPWEADVTFRGLPSEAFAAFDEPGYVKIAWTLRADPAGPDASVFRTETRAVATDLQARARFRRYWAFLSPGIVLIRLLSLHLLRSEVASRLARVGRAS